ncbi:MAG: CgeB family protein [Terriglobales bacterium]
MRIRYFAHSWLSDWNHGNAHFLRGLALALARRGHELRLYEPMPGSHGDWSLSHLLEECQGALAVQQARRALAELDLRLGCPGGGEIAARHPVLDGLPCVTDWRAEFREAEFVFVHEWNSVETFRWLLRQRQQHGFRLLLHDTHHRACSEPERLERLPLHRLDAVVAFGESLRLRYERHGAAPRTYTLHEAADTEHFHPVDAEPASDLVWIGNWGDEERTFELEEFLLRPVVAAGASTQVYGVRYPPSARQRLAQLNIRYGGYLANLNAPQAYARAAVSVHIPRGPYAAALPGIPTIRMFEAMACGTALLSAPWADSETLFSAGEDYWPARNGQEMASLLVQLLANPQQRKQLSHHATTTIAVRHTCAHRAQTLEAICHDLG